MPYTEIWCDPEMLLEHKDVKVYRAYKNDELACPRTYWFVLDPQDGEEEAFDVRTLDPIANNPQLIVEVLKKAIDEGRLTQGELTCTQIKAE